MEVNKGRIFIGRFDSQADLLESLTSFCQENTIALGTFTVIGALTKAKLGYYDQGKHCYVTCIDLDDKLEITACVGNVSLKDEEIFVHAHITLADHNGKCYGGHLMPGSVIFAAEYSIQELTGASLKRVYDQETGLGLWANP